MRQVGCRHCGSESTHKARGLHGLLEFLIFAALLFPFVLPALLYYIVQESRPFCSRCGRRA